MWYLCVLFHFTVSEGGAVLEWLQPVLARIAIRTPPLVLEGDTIVNELAYSKVIRQEYAETASNLEISCLANCLSLLLFAGHRDAPR